VTSYCNAFRHKDRAHDLAHARCATLSQSGCWVYLCCGDCGACYREAVSVWETELRRRDKEAASGRPAVTHDAFYRSGI
jgi:hypothetical protein